MTPGPRATAPDLERVAALIRKVGVGMLVTRARDGHWTARPVAALDAPIDEGLLFFTSRASHKAAEIRLHPRVNASFASPADNVFVSVSGHASVRREHKRIDALWTPAQRLFFPGGKDDPDLTLLRVRIDTVEYWDGPSTLAGKALRLALAVATSDVERMGDNRTLRVAPGGRVREVRGNTRGDAARAESTRRRRGR